MADFKNLGCAMLDSHCKGSFLHARMVVLRGDLYMTGGTHTHKDANLHMDMLQVSLSWCFGISHPWVY